jgi:alpha-L-fucosidase
MGKVQAIKAFTYLPRQDKRTEGVADKYIYSISADGRHWEQVAAGEFANIRANPVEQVTQPGHAVSARYFKLTVLRVLSGNGVTVAELGGQ